MRLPSTLVAALFGVEAVLASPVVLTPRTPRAQRRSGRHTSPRIAPSDYSGTAQPTARNTNSTGTTTSYSANWAGAVLEGAHYVSVTGTVTVPQPQMPPGGLDEVEYSASVWVGLDGDTCQSSILQVGFDLNVRGGQASYDTWYEWYPDSAFNFEGFALTAGDVIRLTVTATNTTSGTVWIENETTGKSVSHTFADEGPALCEANAEWIVEDFLVGGKLMPMSNFGSVTFTNCSVVEATSTTAAESTSSVALYNIRHGEEVYTNCSTSPGTVSCEYV